MLFIKERWATFFERYAGSMLLAAAVRAVTTRFSAEADAADLEAFFATNPAKEVTKTVAQSCEAIRANAAWLRRDDAALVAWASSRAPAA